MSRRFGKARVPDCECTAIYTCSPCLRAKPPAIFTPVRPMTFLEAWKHYGEQAFEFDEATS